MSDDPATANLLMAYSYLEKVKGLLGKDRPEELDQALRFASKHLAECCKYNTTASISITEGKQTHTHSFEQLAACALYFEGLVHNYEPAVAQAFRKAASYQPNDPAHYVELAKSYARQHNRQKALDTLHEALIVDPSYFPAIDLLNKFQDNLDLGRHPHFLLTHSIKIAILLIVTSQLFMFLYHDYDYLQINPMWAWIVFIPLFILLYLIPWRSVFAKRNE